MRYPAEKRLCEPIAREGDLETVEGTGGDDGLEPATSNVTGRRRKREYGAFRSIFNSLRESQGAHSGAATVRATVLDNRFMLVLAYNGCSAGKGGTTAQVGLACHSLDRLTGLGRTDYYFGGSRIKREGQRNKPGRVRRWEQTLFTGREFELVGHTDQFN